MRYYNIEITSSSGNGQPIQRWTTHPNGVNAPPDPGAPLVELDLIQGLLHQPGGESWFRVWGISLQTASQAQRLGLQPGKGEFNNITIRGGMGKGLPLANPKQAGILVQGGVNIAFANWIGTNMTLEGYIVPALTKEQVMAQQPNEPLPPADIKVDWPANQKIGDLIKQTLQAAYPGFTVNVNVSQNLVTLTAQSGHYESLVEFADWVQSYTQSIAGNGHSGVYIAPVGTGFDVYDDQSGLNKQAKQIQFTDMIGQVTWVDLQTVHLPMVMRGDLNLGDIILMPPGQVTQTANSFASFRQNAAIGGKFMINKIRHVGNSRDPSGLQWCTNVFAVTAPTQ